MSATVSPSFADTAQVLRCRLCLAAGSTRRVLSDGKSDLLRCQLCDAAFVDPLPALERAVHDEEYYLKHEQSYFGRARNHVFGRIACLIQGRKSGGRILDVGCAGGYFLHSWFRRSQWKLFGIEPSDHGASRASRRGIQVYQGQASSVELPAGYFDVVTAIDVLYYFREPHQEFRVLRRAIKQDGLLVCCIPFGDTQLLRNATAAGRLLFRGSRSLLSSGHVFFYSARSIRLLLQATGFRVLAIHALPGNRQSRAYQNLLYTGYFAASRFLSWVSFGRLTLSPNYLIIAMPSATEE